MQVGDRVRVKGSKDPAEGTIVEWLTDGDRYAEVSWDEYPDEPLLEEVAKLEVVQK